MSKMKYILYGFWQFTGIRDITKIIDVNTPKNFRIEFDSKQKLVNHLKVFNFTKGTYTFIIEVKER